MSGYGSSLKKFMDPDSDLDPDPVCPERLDPDPVGPERLDSDLDPGMQVMQHPCKPQSHLSSQKDLLEPYNILI